MFLFYFHVLKFTLFIYSHMKKTYNCNVCGTSFARQDVLAKHKKTHKNVKQKESTDPPSPPPAKKQRIALNTMNAIFVVHLLKMCKN